MEEKIRSTIQKIKRLAEQNPEFRQEMLRLFAKETITVNENVDGGRISHIEKYLGLDYYLDFHGSIIDYSFVKDVYVRARLESDNREMLRFRYGTRSHEIDFSEFCRYAQLQSEMMLNYFYLSTDSSIIAIVEHIHRFNEKATISDKVKKIEDISFSAKLWAFDNEFQIRVKEVLDHVREVRNRQSHRTPEEQSFNVDNYQENLRKSGIQFKKDGTADWYFMQNNDPEKYKLYLEIKKSNEFKLYEYLMWYNNKPFDEIITALQKVAETVKSTITLSV